MGPRHKKRGPIVAPFLRAGEALAAEHVVGVHSVEVLAHRLDLAVADLNQEMVLILVDLAIGMLAIGLGLYSHPISLGNYSLGG